MGPPTRRAVLAGTAALAACGRATADAAPPPAGPLPPLKSLASFPLGVCARTDQFHDPVWRGLASTHFDRITPEWEMKVEAFDRPGGVYDFALADQLTGQARSSGLTPFGHTIVWYTQVPNALAALDGNRAAFARAYGDYVRTVAGRYAGQVAGWDVVNEPVTDDGSGYRDCAFKRNLGMDYVRLAFEHAREADPGAVLFLNEYNLESLPRKRLDFMRLAESLLKAGAPLGGLGTQTHVPADQRPGSIKEAVRDLASLGLPVHVSELDISLVRGPRLMTSRDALLEGQERVITEVVQAIHDLPSAQRWGLTLWGLRDSDSWLTKPPEAKADRPDAPLLFDREGRAKPVAWRLADALRGRSGG